MEPGQTIHTVAERPVKRIVLALAIVASLVALSVAGLLTQDNTEYSPNFSEERFELIVPGLPEATVEALIGAPIEEAVGPFPETWVYPQPRSARALFTIEPAAQSQRIRERARAYLRMRQRRVQARGAARAPPYAERALTQSTSNPFTATARNRRS